MHWKEKQPKSEIKGLLKWKGFHYFFTSFFFYSFPDFLLYFSILLYSFQALHSASFRTFNRVFDVHRCVKEQQQQSHVLLHCWWNVHWGNYICKPALPFCSCISNISCWWTNCFFCFIVSLKHCFFFQLVVPMLCNCIRIILMKYSCEFEKLPYYVNMNYRKALVFSQILVVHFAEVNLIFEV